MKALVVEDHAMFRDMMCTLLRDRIGFTSVLEGEDCATAKAHFAPDTFDLVVCDIDLPDGDGLTLANSFTQADPRLRVLAVSSQTDEATLSRIKSSGVIGFVDKTKESVSGLEHAIREVLAWHTYYSVAVHAHTMEERSNQRLITNQLTEREVELMHYFGLGLHNEEVAKRVGLTENTIQGYRRNIMRKLQIKSTPALIREAIRSGFTRRSDMLRPSDED